jgi:hypothetical protein
VKEGSRATSAWREEARVIATCVPRTSAGSMALNPGRDGPQARIPAHSSSARPRTLRLAGT